MAPMHYETHNHDSNLPIIFHYDSVDNGWIPCVPHWHDSIECLYMHQGKTRVFINDTEYVAEKGDLIIIPSNAMHSAESIDGKSGYYTLIVDYRYCMTHGFNPENTEFVNPVSDSQITKIIENVCRIFHNGSDFYEANLAKNILELFIHIFANYS